MAQYSIQVVNPKYFFLNFDGLGIQCEKYLSWQVYGFCQAFLFLKVWLLGHLYYRIRVQMQKYLIISLFPGHFFVTF